MSSVKGLIRRIDIAEYGPELVIQTDNIDAGLKLQLVPDVGKGVADVFSNMPPSSCSPTPSYHEKQTSRFVNITVDRVPNPLISFKEAMRRVSEN